MSAENHDIQGVSEGYEAELAELRSTIADLLAALERIEKIVPPQAVAGTIARAAIAAHRGEGTP